MTSSQTQTFIDHWHRVFAENDPDLMLPLIHEDITFIRLPFMRQSTAGR